MFGISYGELFLILGATAAVIGPKDLPKITRTAGRLAGRAIAYVQLARGHFDSVMQQSQATKVHKELQDTIAQLEAIRYEIRSISMVNPGPLTRRFDQDQPNTNTNTTQVKLNEDEGLKMKIPKVDTMSSSLHSRAMAFAKLAESPSIRSPSNITSTNNANENENNNGLVNVLPVSAESAGLLPKPTTDEIKGSDMFLEAILEAEVASNAKEFFSQHQNQIPEDLQGNGEEKKTE
ncbi:hypothetical protein LUZ60_012874 [Juncus effusus]|nr:hypothetical protein LUZ60_012874 [Juncus effusus]